MSRDKTLKEIQNEVDEWIVKHGNYWPPLSMLSAIMEELGELAREVNHLEGIKPKKKTIETRSNLGLELGDLLFSIICLANYYKIDLSEKISESFKKYSKRDANRFI